MELWTESSLQELYQSAVEAFPATTMRQHATDPIVISSLQWVPFLGMKTLFVKGIAESGSKEYSPLIVFKRVRYGEEGPRMVPLAASDGGEYFLERLSAENTEVLVRCNCQDFYWRWTHADKLDKSLYGRNRKKYEAIYRPGSANPTNSPGICKHLMKLSKVLRESGLF